MSTPGTPDGMLELANPDPVGNNKRWLRIAGEKMRAKQPRPTLDRTVARRRVRRKKGEEPHGD